MENVTITLSLSPSVAAKVLAFLADDCPGAARHLARSAADKEAAFKEAAAEAKPAPKPRGRPKGSKNKKAEAPAPKPLTADEVVEKVAEQIATVTAEQITAAAQAAVDRDAGPAVRALLKEQFEATRLSGVDEARWPELLVALEAAK